MVMIENLEYFKDKKIVVAKNLIESISKEGFKEYKEIKTLKVLNLRRLAVVTHLLK